MSLLAVPEAIAGLLLVFFVPGYCITKATFPEWRVRGPDGLRRLLEIATLSFVLSVVLTVLAGAILLAGGPGGFQAYWTTPFLEVFLFGIAVLAFGVAVLRGAFWVVPPSAPRSDGSGGEEGAWELSRELDRLAHEERRLEHALRRPSQDDPERVRQELERVRSERAALRARREAEYAE
jgi:hypothetical protein